MPDYVAVIYTQTAYRSFIHSFIHSFISIQL